MTRLDPILKVGSDDEEEDRRHETGNKLTKFHIHQLSSYHSPCCVTFTVLAFARHKAWRVAGQMRYLLNEVKGCDTTTEEEALSEMLVRAGEELVRAGRAIRGSLIT